MRMSSALGENTGLGLDGRAGCFEGWENFGEGSEIGVGGGVDDDAGGGESAGGQVTGEV